MIDADVVDSPRFDGCDDDELVRADTATNDNVGEELAMDERGAVVDDDSDDESSSLGRAHRAFRSSVSKKRWVIREDDESTREEEERSIVDCAVAGGGASGRDSFILTRITKFSEKSALNRGSPSDGGETKEEGEGCVGITRRSMRLGRTPIAMRTDPDHSSTDEDSENEFTVDSTASVGKRKVSTTARDEKGGRVKLAKTNEVEYVEDKANKIGVSSIIGYSSFEAKQTIPSASARTGGKSKVGKKAKRVDRANADTGDRVSHLPANENSKIETVAKTPFRKCSSRVSHWVEMAEAKLAAGEAAESSSLVQIDGTNARDNKVKKTARNKTEKLDFEEDSTMVGSVDDGASNDDDDDASEYQPTQGEGEKLVVGKRSPRPSRSSSRIGKDPKNADLGRALGEVVPTGMTLVVAPRRGTKCRQTRKTRDVNAEYDICGEDHIKCTKGRRNWPKSSSINIDAGVCSNAHLGTASRHDKKSKSSKFNEFEHNQPELEHVALCVEEGCKAPPYRIESSIRKVGSLKTSNVKGEKLLRLGTDVSSRFESDKVTKQYDDSTNFETDGLEVEYHVPEGGNEDVDGTSESVISRRMLLTQAFTQAATSQYMEQSMDSSTENSKGGSFGPIEADADHGKRVTKLKSIEMNTRTVPRMRSNVIGNTTPSIKNLSYQIDETGLEEITPVTTLKNARVESNREDNVASCVELTTRGISKMDSASLLAKIQTQSHSQQSSTVSPETRASVAANYLVGKSGKMRSEELEHVWKTIGYHIAEADKIWKDFNSRSDRSPFTFH
ncbi:hypothetical protein ACHAW5_005601 [Stephanodiscus triporus]|uniref:Uncharacterized protein n=1 Tax=Stephanodiscus triporus TaxID=2934178 RepID=A0ABD3QYM6_9STRA